MNKDPVLKTGIIGVVLTGLCCFTPLLVLTFSALGVSAWLGFADYVLLPALGIFSALTVYALLKRKRANGPSVNEETKAG
ncbi:MAG: mercury resistance system transport protein MerF [Rhodospirillales bacterium]|nr:mercury resistance system transport protein MerF [Rhodospirillales bacterium]